MEKPVTKCNMPSKTNVLENERLNGTCHNWKKTYIWENHNKHHSKYIKAWSNNMKVNNKIGMSTLSSHFSTLGKVLARAIRQEKASKWIQTEGKGDQTTPLYQWCDRIDHRSKKFFQKISRNNKQIQKCGRIQNLLAQINNLSLQHQQQGEIMDMLPFTIATRKIIIQGQN